MDKQIAVYIRSDFRNGYVELTEERVAKLLEYASLLQQEQQQEDSQNAS